MRHHRPALAARLSAVIAKASPALDDNERQSLIDQLRRSPSLRDQLMGRRNQLIRQYRHDYFATLSFNAAARQIDEALRLYETGEWRHHRDLVRLPSSTTARRRLEFEVLSAGERPGYEMIRKILRAG